MALELNNSNFAETIKEKNVTLVDFWAPWCGPCKMFGPIIDQLSDDNSDITIGKVNVDDNTELAVEYGIRGIPTILFFKNGEIVEKIIGVKSKAELQEKINILKT